MKLLDLFIRLFMIVGVITVITINIKESKSDDKINWKEVFELVGDEEWRHTSLLKHLQTLEK